MRTRSSSNLLVESPPNASTSNLKRHNRKRSKQPFILEESPVDTIADQRTMAELLRAPTEGYAEAIMGNFVDRPLGMANQNRCGQPHGHNRGNNFNQDQSYQAPTQQNQVVPLSELEKFNIINEANMKAMQTQINNVKNELRNEMKNSIQASMSNQTNEHKNMMASFFQMNTASTSGLGSIPSNTITNPNGELKAITTQSGIVLDVPSIPIPSLFINPEEDERVEETLTDQDLAEYTIKVQRPLLHINITLVDALILIPKYQKMLKALLSNKEKLLELANTPLNENCSAVILKKLLEKLGDTEKFLIPCGFSELKCKALADLGVSINLIPLFVCKKLGRPFLRTARALIDVYREEMIPHDDDERLTLNMRHATSTYSNQPEKESINMINIYDDSSVNFLEKLCTTNHQSEGGNVLIKKFLDLDSTKDLHPPHNINPLNVSTTSSSFTNHLLEEFNDELTLITFPLEYDDDLTFDIDNLADNLVDTVPKMFIEEHAPDYSYPLVYDEYDDDLFKVDDFLPSPEYDSFLSKDFSKVDVFPSTNHEDKVFNPCILIQENISEIITLVAPDKKLAIFHASSILKDFDPPLCKFLSSKKFLVLNTCSRFHLKIRKKCSSPGFTLLKKFILSLS
nr:reverse transcriptase domain-containing protein [Tanacetum cinerariifolium]